MKQAALFPVVTEQEVDCAHGKHGEVIDGPIYEGSDWVNVPRICVACSREIAVVSWTRAAFEAKFGKGER